MYFISLTSLAAALAFSTSVIAQTGTISGAPYPSVPSGAPFPLSNGTGVYPYSTGGYSGGSCVPQATVTSTYAVTVTVTATPSGAGNAGTSAPAGPPYSVPGGGSGPIGTGIGTGYGTGTGSVYPFPTGGVYQKRMEMRGLEQQKKEKKRGHFWG
ncbi:hypothetical protein MMC28_004968 [Mycoblastus sanguinarius]|nr:hypothetical protein [Mycoblastus sanguinarius]